MQPKVENKKSCKCDKIIAGTATVLTISGIIGYFIYLST
jgi:hypothetical protein